VAENINRACKQTRKPVKAERETQMKLLTYRSGGRDHVGVLDYDGQHIWRIGKYSSMLDLIQSGISASELTAASARQGEPVLFSDITKRPPIPNPAQDIICLGLNYSAHAEESAKAAGTNFAGTSDYAIYFSKRASETTADGETIPGHWEITENAVDYEVELAVVIGRDAFKVSKEDAYDYVFGYTVFNDMSARNIQRNHKQFYFGKSLDGFCPMGPWIVTEDEFSRPPALRLRTWVNGELRQDSNTDELIFDIPHIISELSQGIVLKAGTIIATGTPAGVGMGFSPPKYLQKGDVITCEIEGIGRLENEME